MVSKLGGESATPSPRLNLELPSLSLVSEMLKWSAPSALGPRRPERTAFSKTSAAQIRRSSVAGDASVEELLPRCGPVDRSVSSLDASLYLSAHGGADRQ